MAGGGMVVSTYTCECGLDYDQIEYDQAFLRFRKGMCHACFQLATAGGLDEKDRLDVVGKALFSSRARVKIGTWLANQSSNRKVTVKDYWRDNREYINGIHGVMQTFADLGMLRRLPRVDSTNELVFEVLADHPMWEVFRALSRAVREDVTSWRTAEVERAVDDLAELEGELDE